MQKILKHKAEVSANMEQPGLSFMDGMIQRSDQPHKRQ
jgi:hypothetical protein